jgi:hypothetical protein
MGDHGAILVLAPDQESSNKISYSWDEGETWVDLEITKEPFSISNIITEPGNTQQRFIVYGSQLNPDTEE